MPLRKCSKWFRTLACSNEPLKARLYEAFFPIPPYLTPEYFPDHLRDKWARCLAFSKQGNTAQQDDPVVIAGLICGLAIELTGMEAVDGYTQFVLRPDP